MLPLSTDYQFFCIAASDSHPVQQHYFETLFYKIYQKVCLSV